MLGNPGRGKTHMAIGLALEACSLGMNVLVKNAASLSTELFEAKDNYVLGKLEKRILKADLLVLNEMGYVSFDRYQSGLLFKVIADRSERDSVIVPCSRARTYPLLTSPLLRRSIVHQEQSIHYR